MAKLMESSGDRGQDEENAGKKTYSKIIPARGYVPGT